MINSVSFFVMAPAISDKPSTTLNLNDPKRSCSLRSPPADKVPRPWDELQFPVFREVLRRSADADCWQLPIPFSAFARDFKTLAPASVLLQLR